MKISRSLLTVFRCALLLTLAWAYVGCEDTPSMEGIDAYFAAHPYISDPRSSAGSSDVSISPTTATATYVGQQILFKVSGGRRPFEWGVAKPSAGSVTEQRDDLNAVYTVIAIDENNVIVSDRNGSAAIGNITPDPTVALQIIPATTTLTASETVGLPASLHGSTVDFRVIGGQPPYGAWSVSSADLGSINSSGRYTVSGTWGTGRNTVSITDSAGSVVTATVVTQLSTL